MKKFNQQTNAYITSKLFKINSSLTSYNIKNG